MPSFDIVSTLDDHELTNAVDQANREVTTRFDFKDTNSSFTLAEDKITLKSENDFQLNQMLDVLKNKLTKRGIDLGHMQVADPDCQLNSATQVVTMQQGIGSDVAKKIVKTIKDKKMKVQAAIQGDQVRVTGKKRDDLQAVIAMLKEEEVGIPLQFQNFRD